MILAQWLQNGVLITGEYRSPKTRKVVGRAMLDEAKANDVLNNWPVSSGD
jgi:hypothetical protein